VAAPDDAGKFTTEIPKEVMDAAMDAVDKRQKKARGKKDGDEVEVEIATEATEAHDPAVTDPGDDEETQVSPAHRPEGDPEDHEVQQLKAQLEVSQAKGRELMGKIKDEHEKMLRAVADLENYKKRAAKEKEELQRFGAEKLMRDFLPVIDNFDRALEQKSAGTDVESLRKGVEMIRKLFEDALGKHGVKAFTALNKPFDPNFHEAMGQLETKDLPPNHVGNELVRGFMLHERLLRPALVMVTRAPAEAKPEAAGAEASAAPPSDGEKKN
jgi:molecular chaperone GrpE